MIRIATPADFLDKMPEILERIGDKKLILLQGEMGVGKTSFVKAFCAYHKVSDKVSSPTFSIIQEYRSPSDQSIFHMDLYRLENLEEALTIGIEDYFYQKACCLIEWPAIILPILPKDYVIMEFEFGENSVRNIIFR